MKNRVIFYMVCTCISLSSCLDKNNLNLSDRDKEEELDLSFDFGMISEKKLERHQNAKCLTVCKNFPLR